MILGYDGLLAWRSAAPRPVVAVSGGFDPLHDGHVEYIRAAREAAGAGTLIAIVNGDGFLCRKKGYRILPLEARLRVVEAIEGVDAVIAWDGKDATDQTVNGALELLDPDVFAKSGDRDARERIPEWDTCVTIGCQVVIVPGDKIRSSSTAIREAIESMRRTA